MIRTAKNKGPRFQIVDRKSLPASGRGRGAEAMILKMPFWNELVQKLEDGLTPNEAIDIDLSDPLQTVNGKPIPVKRFAARIRYQFHKRGFDKTYSLLVPGNGSSNHLFIVDHETAAAVA